MTKGLNGIIGVESYLTGVEHIINTPVYEISSVIEFTKSAIKKVTDIIEIIEKLSKDEINKLNKDLRNLSQTSKEEGLIFGIKLLSITNIEKLNAFLKELQEEISKFSNKKD